MQFNWRFNLSNECIFYALFEQDFTDVNDEIGVSGLGEVYLKLPQRQLTT